MWRTRAVERMLLEDIAGLARADVEEGGEARGGEKLAAAHRRGWRAVIVDWAALAALVALRAGREPILVLAGGVEVVFALGLLAIAIHSGFRLGQIEKLRAVGRLLEELEARRED